MRIDTHIHLYDPAFGNYDWPPADSTYYRLFDLDGFTQAHGGSMDKAVVVGCSSEPALNQALLRAYSGDARAAAFIAQLDASDPAMCFNARELAQYDKYRGFRFLNRQGLIPDAQVRIAEAGRGHVVEILGNWRDTIKLVPFCAANPEIRFVVEHFGGYLFDGEPLPREYRQFLREMSSMPNIFIKLSGILTLACVTPKPQTIGFYRDAFEAAVDSFGVARCMFGSDWPVLGAPYEVSVEITQEFCDTQSPGTAAAIMGDNAMFVYSIT